MPFLSKGLHGHPFVDRVGDGECRKITLDKGRVDHAQNAVAVNISVHQRFFRIRNGHIGQTALNDRSVGDFRHTVAVRVAEQDLLRLGFSDRDLIGQLIRAGIGAVYRERQRADTPKQYHRSAG